MAVSEAAEQAIWIQYFLYSIRKEAVTLSIIRPQ